VVLLILRTLLSYVLFIILVFIFVVPVLFCLMFPEKWRYTNRFFFWISHLFFKITLWITFLPIKVVGKEHITQEPAIVIANHQSSLDVPLVATLLNARPYTWLAWHSLKKTWFGLVVSRMTVLVDTSSPMRGVKSLLRSLQLVEDKKLHLIIFPEGGRYIDGKIHDFFAGFVILAKKTERPVVPIAILDANKVYPPKAFFIRWYPIKVIVGKPIFYQEGESEQAFKGRVQKWFVDKINEV